MSRLLFGAILGLAFLCWPVQATIINVPADYATMQGGVDAASPGDTVLVLPGTYQENILVEQTPVTLASLFLTTGEADYISTTIIDGDSAGSVVRFDWWQDSTSVLTGFTLTHGGDIYGGGGVHTEGSPVISNNIIENNSATRGGGIYSTGSPVIRDNVIRYNHVTVAGGGIISYGGAFVVERNIITDNSSETYGGGIHIEDSQMATIKDNLIIRNTAENRGGGIIFYTDDMGGNLTGNVIALNEAETYSSIGFDYGVFRLINNTICHNSNTPAGLSFYEYCEATLINNIIWNNADTEIEVDPAAVVSIAYCDIEGGFAGEGNIDIDPLFRDPQNGDFHLMATVCDDPDDSPCIDAGHPDYLDRLLNCDWGLGGLLSDMGGYGGGDSVGIGIDDPAPQLPDQFVAVQAYPNPFNASVVIDFSVPQDGPVDFIIYDIQGQIVRDFGFNSYHAGRHQLTWDGTNTAGEDVSSGLYFLKMSPSFRDQNVQVSGRNTITLKLVLLK